MTAPIVVNRSGKTLVRTLNLALVGAALTWSAGLAAQGSQGGNRTEPQPDQPSRVEAIGRDAGRIAAQPAHDVGAVRREIPPVLVSAAANPYSMAGAANCTQIAASIRSLSSALGPDFVANAEQNEDRASRLAEAGGRAVVNTLIPFRGIVREISGAAPAQRRLNAAIDAGYARRGFLRGLHRARQCRTRL